MISERLNYKECREKVFTLIDKSSILSKEDIVKVLGISFKSLAYTNPYDIVLAYTHAYDKFRNFLYCTRRYAYREYGKSKGEKAPISNIIFFRDIINKDKKTMRGFIQFCEIERIPLLYYVWHIGKYIFPNEYILPHIQTVKFIIAMKTYLKTVKHGVIWGFYRSIDDIIQKSMLTNPYITSFLRGNYIFGEPMEKMFERLEYDKIIKNTNELIKENLYTIADLELEEE